MAQTQIDIIRVVGYIGLSLFIYFVFRLILFLLADVDGGLRNKIAPPRCFRGKVVAITGASSGIGESLAYSLAKRSATLILVARRANELERVLARCVELGCDPKSRVEAADMLDIASHEKLVAGWMKQFGRVDILVANHGRSQRALVEETSIEVDRSLFDLNVFSVMSLTHAVLPHMLAVRSGQIMTTSSLTGIIGTPCSATYSASKHAINGYMKALNSEVCSRGVTVQVACPGPVATPIQDNAFRGSIDTKGAPTDATRRMTANRCAELMAAQLFHKVPEVWMAPQPFLLFTFMAQYCPAITWRVSGKVMGPKRVAAYKTGDFGYKAVQGGMGTMIVTVVKAIFSG